MEMWVTCDKTPVKIIPLWHETPYDPDPYHKDYNFWVLKSRVIGASYGSPCIIIEAEGADSIRPGLHDMLEYLVKQGDLPADYEIGELWGDYNGERVPICYGRNGNLQWVTLVSGPQECFNEYVKHGI